MKKNIVQVIIMTYLTWNKDLISWWVTSWVFWLRPSVTKLWKYIWYIISVLIFMWLKVIILRKLLFILRNCHRFDKLSDFFFFWESFPIFIEMVCHVELFFNYLEILSHIFQFYKWLFWEGFRCLRYKVIISCKFLITTDRTFFFLSHWH